MEYGIAAITGVVGVVAGFFFDRLRKGSAYQDRDEILRQAKIDAENLAKEEELKGKERLLKNREKAEKRVISTTKPNTSWAATRSFERWVSERLGAFTWHVTTRRTAMLRSRCSTRPSWAICRGRRPNACL